MKNSIIFSVIAFIGIIASLSIVVKGAENILYKGKMEIVDRYTGIVETKDIINNEDEKPIYESSEVDGGWWRRGKEGSNLISEYKHYNVKSGASCENQYGFNDGGIANPNEWSCARLKWSITGGNKAYYRHCE